jgi:hypothetical protein
MKFSELLGEPEPERDLPDEDAEPISVFAQVPVTPPPDPGRPVDPAMPPPAVPPAVVPPSTVPPPAAPAPVGARSGLAELNVRHAPLPAPATTESGVLESLDQLETVDDDLLPSGRHRRK